MHDICRYFAVWKKLSLPCNDTLKSSPEWKYVIHVYCPLEKFWTLYSFSIKRITVWECCVSAYPGQCEKIMECPWFPKLGFSQYSHYEEINVRLVALCNFQCNDIIFQHKKHDCLLKQNITFAVQIFIFILGRSSWPMAELTHLSLDKISAISQTTFSNAFSWTKSFVFWSEFHWSLFLRVQLTIFQHWFR